VLPIIGRMEAKYIQSIISIRNKNSDKNLEWKSLSIDKIITKYSNTNIPIYKLIIDDKVIPRNNSYLIKYKCITCKINCRELINADCMHCYQCTNCFEKENQKFKCLICNQNISKQLRMFV